MNYMMWQRVNCVVLGIPFFKDFPSVLVARWYSNGLDPEWSVMSHSFSKCVCCNLSSSSICFGRQADRMFMCTLSTYLPSKKSILKSISKWLDYHRLTINITWHIVVNASNIKFRGFWMEIEPRCCDFYRYFHATFSKDYRKTDFHIDIV